MFGRKTRRKKSRYAQVSATRGGHQARGHHPDPHACQVSCAAQHVFGSMAYKVCMNSCAPGGQINPSLPTGLPRGRNPSLPVDWSAGLPRGNPSIGTGQGLGRYENPQESEACQACHLCKGVCGYDPIDKKATCSGYVGGPKCLSAAMALIKAVGGSQPSVPGAGLTTRPTRGRGRGRGRGRFAAVRRRRNAQAPEPRDPSQWLSAAPGGPPPRDPSKWLSAAPAAPPPRPDPGRCCIDEATGRVECPNGKEDWQAHGEVLPTAIWSCYDGPNGERLCSISVGDGHFSIPACPNGNGKLPPPPPPPGECCFNVDTGKLECDGQPSVDVTIVTEFDYPDGRPGVSVMLPDGNGMRVPLCKGTDTPPPPPPDCCVVKHADGRMTLKCDPDPNGWDGLDVTAFTKCYANHAGEVCAVEFTDPAGREVVLEIPVCPGVKIPPPPPPECCVDASTTPPTLQNCNEPSFNGTPVQIISVDEASGTVMVAVPWSSAPVQLPLCPEPPDFKIPPPPNGCPPGYVRDPVTGDCCPPPPDCPPPPPPPPPWTFPCPEGYLLDAAGNCVQCPPPEGCPTCPPGYLLDTQTGQCVQCPPPGDCPPPLPPRPCPPGQQPPPGITPCGDVPCPVPPGLQPPPPGGYLPPADDCPNGVCPMPVPAAPYPPPPGSQLPPACCENGAMGLPCPHH